MTTIDLSTVTIPAKVAYDSGEPFENLSNLAGVALDILALMKSASVKFTASGEIAAAIMDFSDSVLAVAEMERDFEM